MKKINSNKKIGKKRKEKSDAKTDSRFIKDFEKKVLRTIKKYNLLNKNDKIAVACSGGKDSTVALYIVNKLFKNVTAIAIDEGISGYRNKTIEYLKKFCSQNKIKLRIYSFKEEFGMPAEAIFKIVKKNPCTTCGILRRWLLNKKTQRYTKLVTGHSIEDEAEAIMMNLLKTNLAANARLGPISGIITDSRFTPRVKPLYLCREKDIVRYANAIGLTVFKKSCPYRKDAFRLSVKKMFDSLESGHENIREALIKEHLKNLEKIKKAFYTRKKIKHCGICKLPSRNEICNACKITQEIDNMRNKK